jgi:hypothetical protein
VTVLSVMLGTAAIDRDRSGASISTGTQPLHQPRAWLNYSVKCMGATFPERSPIYMDNFGVVQALADLVPLMPAHLRPALERLISDIPEAWLLAPKSGEVFESKELCRRRLQALPLSLFKASL